MSDVMSSEYIPEGQWQQTDLTLHHGELVDVGECWSQYLKARMKKGLHVASEDFQYLQIKE